MFGALVEQVRRNPLVIILAVAGLTAANLGLDQLAENGPGNFFPSGLMSLAAQYYVTRAALDRAGELLPLRADVACGAILCDPRRARPRRLAAGGRRRTLRELLGNEHPHR